MTDFTIPPAALEAVNRVLNRYLVGGYTQSDVDTVARAACLAMLQAWEGAKTIRDDGRRQTYAIPALILPLPQEASDE